MKPLTLSAFQGAMLVPLLFASMVAADYTAHLPKHYDFQEISRHVCYHHVDRRGLFLDRGLLLNYSTSFLKSAIDRLITLNCQNQMISLTTNSGIVAVVQALKTRHAPSGCLDKLEFGGETICGEYVFGLNRTSNATLPPPPKFISAFSGLFLGGKSESNDYKTRFLSPGSWVSSRHTLESDITLSNHHEGKDDDLKLLIAYTGYQNCENATSKRMFNCGFGVCILNMFVNDGVVNCPFGDCRDEGGCENAMRTSPLVNGVNNATEGLTSNGGLPS
ncbi:uncharacterized protein LOC124172828 [Ischnura elegans]|uniref:uncharacterized protein LOC124172828 n=1 Tax=Ischnura elegans TaxID=197161 RepID=UPI001ED88DD1|nr:uncharacterized protein LOC124172828 [Ischnura elegans]